MQRINVLDKHVAELIAAGEVVERPSSVVKELVENSVDAAAKKIKVEIKRGGTKYIKISDDGIGMYKDDVRNAFLRHATSKLKSANDLDSIGTLGFRGEALASICAVSRVEVITKSKEEEYGTKYINEGGEELALEDAGCANGTTIIIKDLFYNTPARMKFLKTDVAEANSIAGLIDRISLSHPEISFVFIRDGKEMLHTPGDRKISSCIYAVYGKDFFNGMVSIEYKLNGVKVTGYISKPEYSRASRSMQHFFINGRYVKTRTAATALEEAFKGEVMVGKHPCCVIYIEIPYETVDVNVHPSKIEVRFINEKIVFDAVYYSIKNALMANKQNKYMILEKVNSNKDTISSVLKKEVLDNRNNDWTKINEGKSFHEVKIPNAKISRNISGLMDKESKAFNSKGLECGLGSMKFSDSGVNGQSINASNVKFVSKPAYDFKNMEIKGKANIKIEIPKIINKVKDLEQKIDDDNLKESKELMCSEGQLCESKKNNSYKIIGEVFNCYIIIQEDNGQLLFIDKHAAHERLIYEKLKKEEKISNSQMLLEPITVILDKDEYAAVIENQKLIEKSGYNVEDFGMGTIIIRGAPVYVEHEDIKNSIIEIIGYIMKNKKSLNTNYLEWLYHNMACRAAIKAGKSSSYIEIKDLVDKVYNNPNIKHCPHGRPVFISLKKSDIEKQFGRT